MRRRWQEPRSAGIAAEQAELGGREPAMTRRGTLWCDAVGCPSNEGIACAHVDRRSRPCPTAWCPTHRLVVDDVVYCGLHGATMGGIRADFGDTHPQKDNPLPAAVTAASRIIEDDVVAALQAICDTRNEMLISDPVRRVFVGIHRERTWESSWKVCSSTGISVKVSAAIFDSRPDELVIRVNTTVVALLAVPDPDLELNDPAGAEMLISEAVIPVAEALTTWERDNPKETDLVGHPFYGRPAVPVPPRSIALGRHDGESEGSLREG